MEFGPPSEDKRAMMRKVFANAGTKRQLDAMALMYILDESFDRGDITAVLGDIEREKGWH